MPLERIIQNKEFLLFTSSYTVGTGSLPGVKWPERGVDHPHLTSAKVKERVELYIYSLSGPLWSVLGYTSPSCLQIFAGHWIKLPSIKIKNMNDMHNITCSISITGLLQEVQRRNSYLETRRQWHIKSDQLRWWIFTKFDTGILHNTCWTNMSYMKIDPFFFTIGVKELLPIFSTFIHRWGQNSLC